MIVKAIEEINEYSGESINPLNFPDQKFELYSVPSFETGHPEIVYGSEIGSNKQQVQKNDILLCKINPRINRVWKVNQYTEFPMLASSEWIVIRSSQIYPDYLRLFAYSGAANGTLRELSNVIDNVANRMTQGFYNLDNQLEAIKGSIHELSEKRE